MKATAASDHVLLLHILQCMERIGEYTRADRDTFFESSLVQDAVIRNLQRLPSPPSG